jgi:hypothetical protein
MANDDDDHLTIAIRNMTIAAEKEKEDKATTNARIAELEARIVALEEERDSLVEDNASMADQIAELEAKEADAKTKRESGVGGDPPDDPNDPGGAGASPRPLLAIPEWRVRHIVGRISSGERITVYNCMFIDMYSNERRFLRADRFRARIVKAFKQMCLLFAEEEGIPSDVHEIPTDFEVIKIKLHNLATLNQREFIREMFRMGARA